ncbi:hypothetical protein G6011_02113 [Alternaria panax]|uniref:Uncharacterized protein n=1 Tax=Alternaria panax TaxID=48097 RepID=A0AAD4I495_9PLEO|nr:hypothetical protein G6011_02113 [Alternaria panax]
MRFNAILLVVTGLLTFVGAESTKDPRPPCVKQGCFLTSHACVEKCGQSSQCREYCNCFTQIDPMLECRRNGCLPAPEGCDKYNWKRGLGFKHGIPMKRDVDLAAPDHIDQVSPENIDYNKDAPESDNAVAAAGCVEAPQDCDKWEFTERDTALGGLATANSDSIAMGDQKSTTIDHCQVCQAAVSTCQQNCRGNKACEAACNCPVTNEDSCHVCSTTSCSTTLELAGNNDPIDHCQVCRTATYTCQQNCNGDQACKASCLCPSSERVSCNKCQSFNCPSS